MVSASASVAHSMFLVNVRVCIALHKFVLETEVIAKTGWRELRNVQWNWHVNNTKRIHSEMNDWRWGSISQN